MAANEPEKIHFTAENNLRQLPIIERDGTLFPKLAQMKLTGDFNVSHVNRSKRSLIRHSGIWNDHSRSSNLIQAHEKSQA